MSEIGRSTRGVVAWLFRDRVTGDYVVFLRPNPPLIVFIAARAVEWAAGATGTLGNLLHWAGSLALLYWAGDELIRGNNPFRRLLGGVVLATLVLGTITGA